MKIHEYQAKKLLGDYGAPVPSGIVAETAEAARQAAEKMLPCVIKAQVHSGGRGKAGGVKLAKTADEAETIARQMLGMQLVRKNGSQGADHRSCCSEKRILSLCYRRYEPGRTCDCCVQRRRHGD